MRRGLISLQVTMIGCGSISIIRGCWPRLWHVEGFVVRSLWNRVLLDVSSPGGRGRGLIWGEGKRMVMTTTKKRRITSKDRCCIASASNDFGEMSKHYDFCSVESTVYEWWERKGFFKPPPVKLKERPFVIPMPPPNVTGYLHIGHAMFVALQDIIARYHRMHGKATLYLPGTDHAGIATQMLVERSLAEEGLCRTEIGREAFLKRVWSWKEEKGGYIQRQLRRMGASADWTRERFTMDPEMSMAVTEAFIRLHQKGLVYKGDYMVNWSPSLQTAVSDLEVEYREEMGMLYYFKYMLEDNNSGEETDELYIPVATTRPETILGDTAVCVNPHDSRFSHLVGRRVIVPDGSGRSIPVISDGYVDVNFGTGAVKITPGHDPKDYEVGKRYNLPIIVMMNNDASINSLGGSLYEGLDRFECRNRLWEDMRRNGFVISEEEHMQRIPVSQRGGEVIEPMVSTQWFVKTGKMAQAAMDAVKKGEIEIVPERFEKIWYNWLGDGLHDWCVSRQLWWGHRIPVWYVHENGEKRDGVYFVARNEKEARILASEAGVSSSAILVQEEDVLDTWFSSGLWPFATVGWPQEEESVNTVSDFSRFYPASVLETGYDIIFFWVARMVMMGLELTGRSPFRVIYLHGLVRDGKGQKMSKTKGNVVDPIETIDKYGADALRYALVTGITPGQDVSITNERIESSRNFANKLWNMGRFIVGNLKDEPNLTDLAVRESMRMVELEKLPLAERFIVSRCHALAESVTNELERYSMGDAGRLILEFLWDEFADWYIEASKIRLSRSTDGGVHTSRRVLIYVYDTCLRLLHPFMPFITETLWQKIPHEGDSLMLAQWPYIENQEGLPQDMEAVRQFNSLQDTVRSIRNARAEYGVEPGKKIPATVHVANAELRAAFSTEAAALALLARLDLGQLSIKPPLPAPPSIRGVHVVVGDGLEAYLPLAEMIDFDKEKKRLEKQVGKVHERISSLECQLQSAGFTEKAPAFVVQRTKSRLEHEREKIASLLSSINDLSKKDD